MKTYKVYPEYNDDDDLELEAWELIDLEEQFADIIQSKEEY